MAKDTVTGTFGSDNIELNNAATEATLQKLLTAFEKVSGSDTQAKSKLKELGENAKKSSKKVDDLGESAKETSSRLGSGFRNVGQAAFGLTRSFIDGSDTLGEFSSNITGLIKTIPVFGAIFGETIQAFVNVVDSQIEVFRGLSSVGVTFGDSLFDTLRASTRANLALSTFTSVIGSNSTSLALLTGSANRGARAFTDISSRVQENSRNFAALGLTVEETAEYQADFLDIQTRLGLAQQQNSTILGRQTVDYINNLDELSRLTGRQRDEISKSLREEALDRRIGALLGTLDEDARRRLRLVTQTLEGASPEVAEAFREMVATGGVPLSEFGQDLLRTNPRLGEMARGLRDGTVSVEEVMAEFRRTANTANNLTDSQLRLFSTTAALGNTVGAAALVMRGFTNIGEGLNESQLERLKTEEDGANALLGFQAALLGVRNEIIGRLLTTNVFGKLEGILSSVVSVFTNENAIEAIGRGIERFANWMTNLMSEIESGGLWETLSRYAGEAMQKLGDFMVKSLQTLFSGRDLSAAETETRQELETRQQQLSEIPQQHRSEGTTEELDKIEQELKRLDRLDKGLLGPFTESLKNLAFITAGGIAAGLAAIAGSVLLFGNPIALKGAAVLAGLLIGTGAAISLAGSGILKAGEGVEKVGDGLERISQIQNADQIQDISSALGSLGVALAKFTVSDFLGRLLGFFSKDPFEKISDGINQFDRIKPEALTKLSGARDGLVGITEITNQLDPSPVISYTKSINELTDALKDMNNELSGEGRRGLFGTRTSPAAGEVLQQATFSSSQNNENTSLEEVNRTLMNILTVLTQTQDLDRRQLNALRATSNNLYAG